MRPAIASMHLSLVFMLCVTSFTVVLTLGRRAARYDARGCHLSSVDL